MDFHFSNCPELDELSRVLACGPGDAWTRTPTLSRKPLIFIEALICRLHANVRPPMPRRAEDPEDQDTHFLSQTIDIS